MLTGNCLERELDERARLRELRRDQAVRRLECRADRVPFATVGEARVKEDDVDNNIIIASG
jgi:hypothetical protein